LYTVTNKSGLPRFDSLVIIENIA